MVNITEDIEEELKNNKEKKYNDAQLIIEKGNELIKILKNPLHFQQKDIKKMTLFSFIYSDIDNL